MFFIHVYCCKRDLEQAAALHPHSECHHISAQCVRKAICKLKANKNDGNSGMCTDHVIHGTGKLVTLMSLLFDSMVRHACVPADFALSTLIPIPKNKRKSLNASDNYRAIALSNIFGKVLDHALLMNCSEVFSTSSYQFGFKAKHSTSMCTFVVNETIEYFLQKGSNVYCTLLDASKAFDRVEYGRLFRSLISKGICPVVCRFLILLYTTQKIRVKWRNTLSANSSVLNGVKQGGVMSPILFSVYLDDLLCRLRQNHAGCYIENVFFGAFAYADDLVILAPTLQSLNNMLNTCERYASEYNVMFNAQKSKLIVRSRDPNYVPVVNVSFMSDFIEAVPHDKHLGNMFGNVSQNELVANLINDFQRRVNMIKHHFKYLPSHIMYHIFKTYCMPLYGIQLLDLDSNVISRFYVAWRKAIRYSLNLPWRTHSNLLHLICDDLPIDFQLYKRFLKFARSLYLSQNEIVSAAFQLALEGSGSPTGNSISKIADVMNVNRQDVFTSNFNFGEAYDCSSDELSVALAIKDILHMRYNQYFGCPTFYNSNECNMILQHLCTE